MRERSGAEKPYPCAPLDFGGNMFYVESGSPLTGTRLERVRRFISERGLSMGDDAEFTAYIECDGEIAAAGSLCKNVLKYIAVDESLQGEGAAASIVSALVAEAYSRGLKHLFIFTKPENEPLFGSLGFYTMAKTDDVLMMENLRGGIDKYLDSLERGAGGVVGAAVVNCNPFTNGHLYLIEQASAQCDTLHIFVLSEDKSRFDANTRFELVKKGVAHIKNALVHKSEDYLISSATFPTYFLKETADAERINADLDIILFAERIAKRLGITRRFVGTEPYCPVTRAYNGRLKAILPRYGIELIEIERIDGISASRVRELMDEKRLDEIKKLVPETTYECIAKMI